MKWYIRAFKKYAVFSGRESRKAFWMFVLFHILVAAALGFIDGIIMGIMGISLDEMPFGILGGIYLLISLIPSLSISARRLHDAGYSGWWLLLYFVPIVGSLALLVMFILPGEEGPNQYGPPPED